MNINQLFTRTSGGDSLDVGDLLKTSNGIEDIKLLVQQLLAVTDASDPILTGFIADEEQVTSLINSPYVGALYSNEIVFNALLASYPSKTLTTSNADILRATIAHSWGVEALLANDVAFQSLQDSPDAACVAFESWTFREAIFDAKKEMGFFRADNRAVFDALMKKHSLALFHSSKDDYIRLSYCSITNIEQSAYKYSHSSLDKAVVLGVVARFFRGYPSGEDGKKRSSVSGQYPYSHPTENFFAPVGSGDNIQYEKNQYPDFVCNFLMSIPTPIEGYAAPSFPLFPEPDFSSSTSTFIFAPTRVSRIFSIRPYGNIILFIPMLKTAVSNISIY